MAFNPADILKPILDTTELSARLDELTSYLVPSWVPVISCVPLLVALLWLLLR